MVRDRVVELIESGDMQAAIACIQERATDREAVSLCAELASDLYWQGKNLAAAVAIGQHGIGRALRAALDTSDIDASRSCQQRAAEITYNLATFCWLGWDEEGIVIGEDESEAGLAAAKQHVDLIERLNGKSLQRSRSQWIMGAHHLQSGEYSSARIAFEKSSVYAELAGNEPEWQLGRAYAALAHMFANPGDSILLQKLSYRKKELAEMEGGEEFAEQVETAERVFRARFEGTKST